MRMKILFAITCLLCQALAWGQTPVIIKTSEGKNLRLIYNYTITPNALLFHATTGDGSREGIWRTDGTDKGTSLLISKSANPGLGVSWRSISYNGYVYFLTDTKANSGLGQIWRSDGTENGTSLFFQLTGGGGDGINNMQSIVFKNELYFAVQNRVSRKFSLHKTDGKMITLIKSDLSTVSELAESGGYVCFSANSQLWRTDGTESGTKVIPTPSGIDITLAGALPNGCIYNADYYINSVRTFGLYITDVNGKTSLLGEVAEGVGRFYAYFGTTIGNKMYFFNSDDNNSNIWVTNGTKEGTKKLIDKNIVTKIGSDIYKYQDNIYFLAGKYSSKNSSYRINTTLDTYEEFFGGNVTSDIYFNYTGNYFYVQTSEPQIYYTDGNTWKGFPFKTYTSKLGEFRNEVYVEYLRSAAASPQDIDLVKVKVKNPNPDCDNFSSSLKSTDSQTSIACNGNLNLLTSTSGGAAPFTYQWIYEGAIIDGANGATFSANKAGTYSVSIKDSKGCNSTTNSLTLTSNSPKVDVTGNLSICTGQNTTLTANVTGGVSPYTYQWKQNSTNVGTNAITFTVSTAGSYSVSVTDSKGCMGTSAAYSVTQKPSPNVTVSSSRTPTLLTGESVVLSVPTAAGQTYQWAKDGVAIAGAINNSYTVSGAGSYTVAVTGSGCTATSSAVMVSIILANEPLAEEVGLRISPNPAINQAKIVLQLAQTASANVYVLDASGRRVRTWESGGKATRHEVMLDMRSVAAGNYVVQAEAEGQVFTEKLVKQ